MNHTPTPWHSHDMETGIICSEGGLPIVACNAIGLHEPEQIGNAAFIVRAVNCHEELIQALRDIIPTAESYVMQTYDRSGVTRKVIARAAQAIAKAEGR